MEESFELLHPSCYIVISLKLALVLVLALFIFPLYFQMLYVLCWVYLALLCVDRASAVILSAIYLMFLRDLHIFSCSASLFLFYLIFCWLVLSFFFSWAPLSAGSVLHATMLPCHPGSPLHPAPLRIFYLPTSSRRSQLPPPGPLHTLSLSLSLSRVHRWPLLSRCLWTVLLFLQSAPHSARIPLLGWRSTPTYQAWILPDPPPDCGLTISHCVPVFVCLLKHKWFLFFTDPDSIPWAPPFVWSRITQYKSFRSISPLLIFLHPYFLSSQLGWARMWRKRARKEIKDAVYPSGALRSLLTGKIYFF